MSWSVLVNATGYDIYRSSGGGVFGSVGSVVGGATQVFVDSTALANTAYLYQVRGTSAGGNGAFSSSDLATTAIVGGDLVSTGNSITTSHFTQLRTAVNAVRTLAGLSSSSFTDPTLTAGTTSVKNVHVTELRTALDAARSALALSAASYADATLTAGTTLVKIAHVNDLRNGVK